ncbi:MAG: hypothetical protein K5634_03390, partial [Sphaerochaetaceae bacterium]|nr:hypothetical protein [Sphaerochaetaceae bacterium]
GFSARETTVTPALQEYRLWQALANFGGIDYFVMGTLDNKKDKRAYEKIRGVFSYAAEHEELLSSASSCADVLLVRSSYQIPDPEERGWIRVLTELHIPFDETLTASLGDRLKDNYKLIIMPNKGSIPAPLVPAISSYVKNGGKLLCSAKVPARDSQFLEILGLDSVSAEAEVYGSYFRTEEELVVPVGDSCLKCSDASAESLYSVMPAQKFGPPEVCYVQEEPTQSFGLYINTYGNGKAAFIPWKAGSLYYSEGYDVWFEFMKKVLEEKLGALSVAPTLSPMVEVTVGRCKEGTLLSFVNGSGHFGNSFFSPVEIENAVIELPWNEESFSCTSLYRKDNCTAELIDRKLRITVKKLGFFEQIVVNR